MKTSPRATAVACFILVASPIFGAENNGCYPTPADLLAFWPAEGTAMDVADVFVGSVEGDTGFGPGKVGVAFDFPGTAGSLVRVNPAPVSVDFTI